ncbi:bifunctional DNA-formamidopyrimidine glycosylase/DNA-(apurinic or apyrimidinic site) lyase [Pseudomaricurvus alkylphenolicus]|jgi:formamidopyrimidine-DNA glycosylase|uniref:bifunctional DNA-formamidopyrimidine glycosylase/DNA-(apurinic or apyrimidinic site) lyase n=1 Tax=Pseudomaricurvus alkylphenolicus TaxID=1306991 RepID=UPI00141F1169|nr:bifunctional DNA-formamidopyrimidine glycosylase/DNA-(apurinic or apyrimidinic site) lyase [Pseudomaricurvus alkylphenolicus]NIB39552.1 bifunctional DNA-formamidopyrimidine glycosylase/DNA-(apurinic or apyrimidinic site) lyase [Pseudomaricurvus alkylphenolicus]
MPELPEVETTRRGIEPHILGRPVQAVTVRQPSLRWPVPDDLASQLEGRKLQAVLRRGKYLLLGFSTGTLILHLGMSGSLRIVSRREDAGYHDHVDIDFGAKAVLRLNDPRRFGAVLFTEEEPEHHPLIEHLGPEPLSDTFSGDLLYQRSRKRKQAVKTFIMDSKIVVGVGNIYANEALFSAGIRPTSAAGRISKERYRRLASEIKAVLARAIEQGGTTLRDFVGGDGKPGYFQQQLLVYGRTGKPCRECDRPLKEIRLGQRSTVYCSHCQR